MCFSGCFSGRVPVRRVAGCPRPRAHRHYDPRPHPRPPHPLHPRRKSLHIYRLLSNHFFSVSLPLPHSLLLSLSLSLILDSLSFSFSKSLHSSVILFALFSWSYEDWKQGNYEKEKTYSSIKVKMFCIHISMFLWINDKVYVDLENLLLPVLTFPFEGWWSYPQSLAQTTKANLVNTGNGTKGMCVGKAYTHSVTSAMDNYRYFPCLAAC